MSLSKEINAITECSICTETFVDPRVLPCVHTFCLKCLEAYGKTQKSPDGLACPLCRAKFDIPFSDLPVNFFILKLIDVNKVARKPNEKAPCDGCSGQNDDDDEEVSISFEIAAVYCFDCRQSLCRKCHRVHNRLRHNRCHLVVEFGKKQPDELLKISPTYCEAHQDEIVKFFCSDCQKAICMACYVESHSSHKCGNVAKVAEDCLDQLREDVSEVSQHIKKCLSEEKKLATRKEQFLQLIQDKEVLAKDMMKEMSDLVEAHGKQILEDLLSLKSVKLKEFETAGNEIQDRLIMMESFKKYSEEVMIKATPADVTRLASMLKKRAAELHAMRLDNDLYTYEIDIHSVKTRKLLESGDENSVGEVVVYSNRKDNAEVFLSPSMELPMQVDAGTRILGMTAIGDRFYLLRGERNATESVQDERRLLATGTIRLQLPNTFVFNGNPNYRITSYTQCNSLLFHLQVLYSKVAAVKTLQLQVSDLHLVEADTNLSHLTNSVALNFDPTGIGQPSSINQVMTLRTPQKLYVHGFHGTSITIQASGNNMSLSVTASFSQFSSSNSYSNKTIIIPMTYSSTPTPAAQVNMKRPLRKFAAKNRVCDFTPTLAEKVPQSSKFSLEVFTIKVNAFNSGSAEVMKPSNIVFLPMIDPTDMVSCSYYDCLYMGDQLSSNIHRVDSRVRMTVWPVQSIPNGLSVTHNHTVLVTSSQIAKLLEYTTLGVQLRQVCLTGVTIRPSHAMEIDKDKFIVVTESELNLQSQEEAMTENAEKGLDLVEKTEYRYVTEQPKYFDVEIEKTQEIIVEVKEQAMHTRRTITDVETMEFAPEKGLDFEETTEYRYAAEQPKYFDVEIERTQEIIVEVKEQAMHTRRTITDVEKMESAPVKTIAVVAIDDNSPSSEPIIIDQVPDAEKREDQTILKAVTKILQDIGPFTANDRPIRTCIDQFGFIFVLTATKVHLLDPQLKYIRELISLDGFGMQDPKHIHFQPESGRLYVASTAGTKQFLVFQITEGKVDQCVWKK